MPGGNPFEDMSHERMLQWLDQANSGTVQSAADRLAKAAEEMHKIAEELKVRPQWVEWKGEGADAFRAWTADLANSTLRLGDFSESSAKWLAQASDAIARAQAAIPRDTKGAEANRVAAASAPNDPDADKISTKSTAELAALAADKEKVRREAAAEMIKLGQAYEFSAVQLNALERPKFPPPPDAIVPRDKGDSSDLARPDASGRSLQQAGTVPLDSTPQRDVVAERSDVGQSLDKPSERVEPTKDVPPTRMSIDSVEVLLPDKQTTSPPVSGAPAGRPDGSPTAPPTGLVPSVPGGGRGTPTGGLPSQGRSIATGRVPQSPGPIVPPSRAPISTGIIGGRPVTPPMGGPTGAVHRGTVVGGPSASSRMPVGPTPGTTTSTGRMVGQQGHASGGRIPTKGGVIGGTPDRTGRAVLGAGGTAGSGATGGGMARGGVVGGAAGTARSESAGAGTPRAARPAPAASADSGKSRARSASDQKSRRQDSGRPVPPVID